jgi:hypothetical protein
LTTKPYKVTKNKSDIEVESRTHQANIANIKYKSGKNSKNKIDLDFYSHLFMP